MDKEQMSRDKSSMDMSGVEKRKYSMHDLSMVSSNLHKSTKLQQQFGGPRQNSIVMMVGNKVVLNHTQSNIRDSNVETNGNMNNYMKTYYREFNQLQLSMN